MLILSLVLLAKGQTMEAVLGLLVVVLACAAIVYFSPWRHPQTQYRRLLIPIYILLLLAIGWGVWAFGGPNQMGINSWWAVLILLPVLGPIWTVGNRRWEDGNNL